MWGYNMFWGKDKFVFFWILVMFLLNIVYEM